MPELPEVETVRRGLQPVLEGARIERVETRRLNLRYPFPECFSERLAGRHITALGRRAKYLTADIEDGPLLICHLGMSGSFRIEAKADSVTSGTLYHEGFKSKTHDHVVFHIEDAKGAPARVVFNDPRRFGFMLLAERSGTEHPMLASLGVEPTGNNLDGELLSKLFRDKKASLKATLLDQRLIAGLGNIYVCEALWRSGLGPKRAAGSISGPGNSARAKAELLAISIRDVIADAIAAGGSSLRDYIHTDGSLGYFQHSLSVYDREGKPCAHSSCAGHIDRIVQSGRSTFYCCQCQR